MKTYSVPKEIVKKNPQSNIIYIQENLLLLDFKDQPMHCNGQSNLKTSRFN